MYLERKQVRFHLIYFVEMGNYSDLGGSAADSQGICLILVAYNLVACESRV